MLKYYVMLALIDGTINDMEQTIDCIVEASHTLQLSIVIVGIGNGPFEKMSKFNSNKIPLAYNRGRRMPKKVVQFVEFNKVHEKEDL